MVTIENAGYKHGYSGYDHFITGHECDEVIGRSYRSIGEARAAASRAADAVADREVRSALIWLSMRMASGRLIES